MKAGHLTVNVVNTDPEQRTDDPMKGVQMLDKMNHQSYLDLVYRAKGAAGEAAFNEAYKRTGCMDLSLLAKEGARRGVREALLARDRSQCV